MHALLFSPDGGVQLRQAWSVRPLALGEVLLVPLAEVVWLALQLREVLVVLLLLPGSCIGELVYELVDGLTILGVEGLAELPLLSFSLHLNVRHHVPQFYQLAIQG